MTRYAYIDEKRKHLHTLDGKPLIGTSTVAKMLGGEKVQALMNWAIKAGIGMVRDVWKKGEIDWGNVDQVEDLLEEAQRAHNTKRDSSAAKGTDRHEILEGYVKTCMRENDGKPLPIGTHDEWIPIQSFISYSILSIKKFLWSELHCYSEELWTGGIADVGWLDMQDRVIAGDFKSSREGYFDQYVQVGGYDLAISENGGFDKDGNKIFDLPSAIVGYCIIPFGSDPLVPEFVFALENYRDTFKGLVKALKSDQEHISRVTR